MLSMTPFPPVFVGDGIVEEDPVEWLRQVRLFALGRPESDKIKVFELCLAPGSPAEGWYDSQNPDKPFKSLCQSFQKEFPGVQYAPLPAWLPLERLETFLLKEEDLGKEVEDGEGSGVFLPSHVVYARRIQRLAAAVPEPEAQLVANARHRLPPAVKSLVPKHVKAWDEYIDALLAVSTFDIMKAYDRLGGGSVAGAYATGGFDGSPNGFGVGSGPPPLHRHGSSASSARARSNTYDQNLPAPHIAFAGEPNGFSAHTNIPVHISSGSERENSPQSYHGPNFAAPANTSSGRYNSGRNNSFHSPNSAIPYDRDTPSAPPMSSTRTWLATGTAEQKSPSSNGSSGGSINGRSGWART